MRFSSRLVALLILPVIHAIRVIKQIPDGASIDFASYFDEERASPVERRLLGAVTDDHRVVSLPGLEDNSAVTHYAGHILVDQASQGHFFYWLVEAAEDSANKPLIIWLNGGPGCSSMDGMWLELGPFRLDDDGQRVHINPHSWHHAGNLLFIDQPFGTGFSFLTTKDGYAKNDQQVNAHLTSFLNGFFAKYPNFVSTDSNGIRRTRALYFTGESHAGHYIPSLVAHLLEADRGNSGGGLHFSVEGIAIGNPWIDPVNQYNPAEFAHGLGLISQGQVNKLKQQESTCQQYLSRGVYHHSSCMDLLDAVIDGTTLSGANRLLLYDTRVYMRNSKVYPPGHDCLEAYFNRPEVRMAIHASATPHRFQECADPPYYALIHQDGKGVMQELSEVLRAKIRVLVYSGQYDLVCNHLGTEAALKGLDWEGKNEWTLAQPGVWLLNQVPVGYLRTYRNLQSLLVLNSGHMVPMDAPMVALEMISAFVNNRPLQSGLSKVGVVDASPQNCKNEGKRPRVLQEADGTSPVAATTTDAVGSERVPNTHVVLVSHLHPLADRVHVRLRLQHVGPSSATSDVRIEPCALRIEPRGILFPIDGKLFNTSHAHADIAVTDLVPGQEYVFTTESIRVAGQPMLGHPAMRRHHKVTVGCYREGFSQCCHHGVCTMDRAPGSTICRCDPGYSGDVCNQYLVASHNGESTSHVGDHGDSVLCATKAVAMTISQTWSLLTPKMGSRDDSEAGARPIVPSMPKPARAPPHDISSKVCLDVDSDCCAEVGIALLASTSSTENILDHRQELAALLEHDMQASLVTVQTGQVSIQVKSVHAVHGETRATLRVCSSREAVVATLRELQAQAHDSFSALRRGMVSDRIDPVNIHLLAHGEGQAVASVDPSSSSADGSMTFTMSRWNLICIIGALAVALVATCLRGASRVQSHAHDRLPTSVRT